MVVFLFTFFLFTFLSSTIFGLSVSFYNLNIKDALNIIAAEAGVPIVYEPNLTGTVTVEFESENVENIIEIVLKPFNYYWTKIDGIYYVGTMNPTNPNFFKVATLLEVPVFHADAEILRSSLPKSLQDYILSTNDSNRLLIYAPINIGSMIANLITRLDTPSREAKIIFKVLDVSEGFLDSFALTPGTGNLTGLHINILQLPISGSYVNLLFQGKEDSQRMRILSTGQLTAQNGRTYKITLQNQLQTQQITEGKVSNVQNPEVFEVTVTPRFAAKKCHITLNFSYSGILFGTNSENAKRGATLSSNVSLDYGVPYVLGAISYEKKIEKEGGISILGNLPFIGSLFKVEILRKRNTLHHFSHNGGG